jgi:GDP-L-fucose synthase
MSDLRVMVAGSRGLVGRALVRQLRPVLGANLLECTRDDADLSDPVAVDRWFASNRPTHVYLAAGRVGGIADNASHPAEFIRENLLIAVNVIDAAWRHGVTKLLYLGSSCIYPRMADQPIAPSALLSGALEETNRSYAVAKIAGIEMCRAYRKQYGFNAIAAMPTNLFGPHDNFDPERSHVLPALMLRFADAIERGEETVTVWGSGRARREFLHVDDLARGLVHLMDRYDGDEIVNIGTGIDLEIRELVELLRQITGFSGKIIFDTSRPDGTPRKVLDVSHIHQLGWRASIDIAEGLAQTWRWYCEQRQARRLR